MSRHVLALLVLALTLSACLVPPEPEPTTTLPHPTATTSFPTDPTPTDLPSDHRIVLRSASLSLAVDDPATALADLQVLIEQAGGYVVSASSWSSVESGGYASLNARVPPESLAGLRRAALDLAAQSQSDSLYTQDVTAEVRRLHTRLQNLARAEQHLWGLLLGAPDPQTATSLTILRELLQEEKLSIESQLADYHDRSTLASFDVTLNPSTLPLYTIE